MGDKLKPLSELQRKFLAKLGETPAEHQSKVNAIINKVYNKANDTKVDVHVLNKQAEAKLTYSEPTADIVRRLEGTAYIAEEWVPQCHVLFIRRWHCKCGRSGSCLDAGQLFLRYRRSRRTADEILSGHSSPYLYLPVKSLTYPKLPRLQEVRIVAQPVCEECFACQKLEPSSCTEAIESSTSIIQPGSQVESSIEPSTNLQEFQSCTKHAVTDACSCITQSLDQCGLDLEKSSQELPVPVTHTNTPITEERACA